MKIILVFLFGALIFYIAFRFFLKRLVKSSDLQKLQNKIVGPKTIDDILEIDFLARYFKLKLPVKWKTKIREDILLERFKELTKNYNLD